MKPIQTQDTQDTLDIENLELPDEVLAIIPADLFLLHLTIVWRMEDWERRKVKVDYEFANYLGLTQRQWSHRKQGNVGLTPQEWRVLGTKTGLSEYIERWGDCQTKHYKGETNATNHNSPAKHLPIVKGDTKARKTERGNRGKH